MKIVTLENISVNFTFALKQSQTQGGINGGSCAGGFGVCCYFEVTFFLIFNLIIVFMLGCYIDYQYSLPVEVPTTILLVICYIRLIYWYHRLPVEVPTTRTWPTGRPPPQLHAPSISANAKKRWLSNRPKKKEEKMYYLFYKIDIYNLNFILQAQSGHRQLRLIVRHFPS